MGEISITKIDIIKGHRYLLFTVNIDNVANAAFQPNHKFDSSGKKCKKSYQHNFPIGE